MDKVTFDLAICTFGRPDCVLSAVERSKSELSEFSSLIVIDNNPTGLANDVKEVLIGAGVKIVHEPKAGLSTARNRALNFSSADYLWFIDDDASLVEGFAAHLNRHRNLISECHPDVRPSFGGGFILAASTESNISTIGPFELGLLSCMNPLHPFSQPWGANMFVDRQRAVRVGGFDPNLGWVKEAGSLLGEEDDLYLRLCKGNPEEQNRAFFADGCGVNHWIPITRRKFSWLMKRAFKGGRSNFIVYQHASKAELFQSFRSCIRNPNKDNLFRLSFVVGKMFQKYVCRR